MPDDTKSFADKGPAARAATKEVLDQATKDAEAKAAASQNANAELDAKKANPGKADIEVARSKPDSVKPAVEKPKPDFTESGFDAQGHTKITREAGDENTGKPSPADVVQQGGGGAVDAKTGKPA